MELLAVELLAVELLAVELLAVELLARWQGTARMAPGKACGVSCSGAFGNQKASVLFVYQVLLEDLRRVT